MPEQMSVERAMSHLSIGEVLGLLLEEFPDVTISKIRFLESQGLIDPERTPSGYRKFYDDDVELLRCILREQRENYLPLRVIKDRIDSGEIDPTGEQQRPRGIRNVGGDESGERAVQSSVPTDDDGEPITGAAALFVRTDGEVLPSVPARVAAPTSLFEPAPAPSPGPSAAAPSQAAPSQTVAVAPTLLPGVLLDPSELCAMSGLTANQLAELESYGVLSSESSTGRPTYNDDALAIAISSKRFLDAGVDARHLRGWRVAAEREAGLLDQLVQPLLRQRNPEARAQAIQQLIELEAVGGRLRSAMMREALRSHVH
jgi:DNA-binding transcriptional MerR regulator